MRTILNTLIAVALVTTTHAFDQTHSVWTQLLGKHVKATGVDYPAFQKDHAQLKGYLGDLAGVSRTEFNQFSGENQLAYLINLYNAATVDLVLDNYPISSFKDEVGGKEGPWKVRFIKALGSTYTLDQVEHELIRKNFNEPRIHFAVNCASVGCPPLRTEAFTGAKLEGQLQEQTQTFLANSSINRLEGKTLALSPIFDWFKDDFIKKSGSVEAFVNPYFPKTNVKKGAFTLRYTTYDWNLNKA